MIDIKSQIIKPALSLEDLKVVASAEGWKLTDLRSLHFFLRRNFKYRRKITITELSGNDLTDYQILIELDSSNFDFSHTQANGEDIRFVDANGNLLPHWIEEWDSVNKKAKVWVKVPSIPANSEIEIYMYYGNESVRSMSNGYKVFPLFDDFEDATSVLEMKLEMVDGGVIVPCLSNIYQGNVGFIYNNKLYVSFVTTTGLNCLIEHDYETEETKVVGVDYCTADVPHGGPHICVDKDGYFYMFIGCHGSECKVWKTKNPNDISEWEQKTSLPGDNTYPQPFVLPDNTLIVIARQTEATGKAYIHMYKSTDGGETWIDTKLTEISTGGSDNRDYPFPVIIGNTIYLGIGRHIDEHKGICFMMSTDGGETWTKADGTSITLPATLDQVDQVDLSDYGIYAFPMPVGDKIVIPYVLRGSADRDAILKVAIWDGSTWTTKQLSILGKSSNAGLEMGLIPLSDTNWLIYTGKRVGDLLQLFKWETTDSGGTWTETQLTNYPETVGRVSPVWDYENQKPLNQVFFGYGNSSDTATIKIYPQDVEFPIPNDPTNWHVTYTGSFKVYVKNSQLIRDIASDTNDYKLASLTSFDFPSVLTLILWNCEEIGNTQLRIADGQAGIDQNGVQMVIYDDRGGGGGTDHRVVEVKTAGTWSTAYSETVTAPLIQNRVEVIYDLSKAKFIVDGAELVSVNLSVSPYYIQLPNMGSRGRSVDKIDTIFLRKYTEPEPSVSVGAEETA